MIINATINGKSFFTGIARYEGAPVSSAARLYAAYTLLASHLYTLDNANAETRAKLADCKAIEALAGAPASESETATRLYNVMYRQWRASGANLLALFNVCADYRVNVSALTDTLTD